MYLNSVCWDDWLGNRQKEGVTDCQLYDIKAELEQLSCIYAKFVMYRGNAIFLVYHLLPIIYLLSIFLKHGVTIFNDSTEYFRYSSKNNWTWSCELWIPVLAFSFSFLFLKFLFK